MNQVIECAFCDRTAHLKSEQKQREFRKETFITVEHYYKCESGQHEFTTTKTDEVNVLQLYNQYRERNKIPFPAQITKLREKYNLSASKMSAILGFGANVYRNYEKGEIPSVSHARYLSLVTQPEEFKKLVNSARELLDEPDYKKIINHINKLLSQENAIFDECNLVWKSGMIPDQYTGYVAPSFEKFANMALSFLEVAPFKVKLNKLLYYADFLNFKQTGYSISGAQYQALQMGPVPFRYDWNLDQLIQRNYIEAVPVEIKNEVIDKFVCLKSPDESMFTSEELKIIKTVKEKLGRLTTKDVVKMSHEESGWLKENKMRTKISYQKYGFELIMGNL